MADSDDEYDRKRRDKFRGERTESYRGGDGGRRTTGGEDRRRDDWMERDSWSGRNRPRQDYREYRGAGARERYSPARQHDISPPMKRMRHDWRGGYGGAHEGYGGGNYGSSWQHSYNNVPNPYGGSGAERDTPPLETQPPMQSFKQYLQSQDDNITDEEAIRKYNEYKLEFRRLQLNEFFVAHKDEEWFKIKYHPEEAINRKEEQMKALQKRVTVFLEFLEGGRLDKLSVDNEESEQLVRLLDAVVIRLEGGTDFDLQVLDEHKFNAASAHGKIPTETVDITETDDKKPSSNDVQDNASNEEETSKANCEKQSASKSKKRKREYDSGNEDDSGSDSGDDRASTLTDTVDKNGVDTEECETSGVTAKSEEKTEENDNQKEVKNDLTEDTKKEEMEVDDSTEKEKDKEDECSSKKSDIEDGIEDNDDVKSDNDDAKSSKAGDESKEDVTEKEEDKKKIVEEISKPRPLHRTASIFLRSLAPTITKQEVEAMCKRYNGFMRVAIADPQPDRRWFRRGWVTFERNVNIKEICWNLNNIRLRDCELGAIVNRDLSRRIRTVSGITAHKQVVRNDIKVTAKIVHNLDTKAGLWLENESLGASSAGERSEDNKESVDDTIAKDNSNDIAKDKSNSDSQSFGLVSKNPVLKNITDYLIEEASAEEEELLGQSNDQEEGQLGDDAPNVEKDEALLKVLDRLLLYLRIVHSVDYYNHCEYPNEDEMPNRCGIMHARGTPLSAKVTQQEILDYCRMFEQKIASFLLPAPKITDEELLKLGAKDPELEVEKFVQANTQEIAKDKWLCPLSGKKFKGPEFVRKHVFNKHGEKVEEVKKEVEYFNNYLKDPKRPMLPEHPLNRADRKGSVDGARDGFAGPAAPYPPHYQMNYGAPRHGNFHYGSGGGYGGGGGGYSHGGYNSFSRGNRGGFNRGRGGGSDYRPVIHYRDLDAPRENDDFI